VPRHEICPAEELPPGARRIVTLDGRSIGVLNVDGRLYALRNTCPHQGAPLCQGVVSGTMLPSDPHEYVYGKEGTVIRCPWHKFEFDLESGRSLHDAEGMRVKVYPVSLENGHVVLHTP
jgi:nitrite reductase (NADH) small subunit